MPITFGSVGDIISVSLLVKDLLLALDSSKGSSTEYRAVVSELNILDKALLQVAQLANTHAPTPELLALWETAKHSVDKCRIAVDSFTKRIDKYKNSLGKRGSHNSIKDAARKVQWQICQKDEITRFRVEIAGYTDSITMLVATANVALLKITHTSVNDNIEKAAEQSRLALDHQNEVLKQIQGQLADSNKLTETINSVTTKMSDRFEWIRNLGKELKILMIGIMATNFRIYREVVAIRTAVDQIGRPLSEDPFTLDNPIGRNFPVHLRFITSWEAFESVMELNFKGRRGLRKVKRKDYILHEQATNKEIMRAQDWDDAFLPGQSVTMSLIFRDEISGDSESNSTQCPHCRAVSDRPADTNTQCKNCKKWFCRIVEICEIEQPVDQFQIPVRGKTPIKFGEASLKNGKPIYGPELPRRSDTITPPQTPPRTPPASTLEREAQSEDDDEDITGFKRLHFLTRKLRYKRGVVFSSFAAGDAFQTVNFDPSTAKNISSGQPSDWNKWEFPAIPAPSAEDATSSCDEDIDDGDASIHEVPNYEDFADEVNSGMENDDDTVNVIGTGREELGNHMPDEKVAKFRTSEGFSYEGLEYSSSGVDLSHLPKDENYAYTKLRTRPATTHHNQRYSYQSSFKYRYTGGENAWKTPPFYSTTSAAPSLGDARTGQSRSWRASAVPPRYINTRPKPTKTPSLKDLNPQSQTAIEQDARRAGIPAGYSTKNWDSTEEPLRLLGSVFDANSLGKWIYDWTVFYLGPVTPMSDLAGELWLLLIQLAGKIKRANVSVSRIKLDESRELVEDFLDSGERLWVRFKKLLKVCEDSMWKAAKKSNGDKTPTNMNKNSGRVFVDTIFGRDHELDKTEKLMSAIRLWSMRFDANCDEILRNPTAGCETTAQDIAPLPQDTTTFQPVPSNTLNRSGEQAIANILSEAERIDDPQKRKLDYMGDDLEEAIRKRQHISTETQVAQKGQHGDARDVEDTKGLASPAGLKRKAEGLEKEQANGLKRTKVAEEKHEAVT
ncbi:hypothetical protein E6O75_ATG04829 [Venturia nashicola]|uniref:Uncharacterized protein n=1 Tax=Venturia nashicola TaxID=86259 RepID=A0A4Z1P4G4_9PEZI|nr:hypothetical protein E6O75_ATG04829 [Venturia nashicola]